MPITGTHYQHTILRYKAINKVTIINKCIHTLHEVKCAFAGYRL